MVLHVGEAEPRRKSRRAAERRIERRLADAIARGLWQARSMPDRSRGRCSPRRGRIGCRRARHHAARAPFAPDRRRAGGFPGLGADTRVIAVDVFSGAQIEPQIGAIWAVAVVFLPRSLTLGCRRGSHQVRTRRVGAFRKRRCNMLRAVCASLALALALSPVSTGAVSRPDRSSSASASSSRRTAARQPAPQPAPRTQRTTAGAACRRAGAASATPAAPPAGSPARPEQPPVPVRVVEPPKSAASLPPRCERARRTRRRSTIAC